VSRHQITNFISEGEAMGMDIATVASDENQLAITSDVVAPGSVGRMLQLLSDEPTTKVLGPSKASDVNVRTKHAGRWTTSHLT
jgi:hypothetical protein